MSTQAIERNYRKNPHTARFLQTFHSGIGSNGMNYRSEIDDNRAEVELAASEGADLLNLVPVDEVRDLRTPGQVRFMDSLVSQISALDSEAGTRAKTYTDGMTEHGRWTPGRNGTASTWIDRMLAKLAALKSAAPAPTTTAPVAQVEDGRYAVEEDGVLKFFKVKNGGRPGFVFLDVQASDDWHAIRVVARIRKIVELIAQDPHAAMVRYGHELGECGRCGRTLTDEASRAAGIGPVCASK